MGMLGVLAAGCTRQIDLAKIVAKNIAYEFRNPVQDPASKLKFFPKGNPGIHMGWVGHSTVLLSFYGTLILTDPNFASRIVIARRVVGLPIEPEEIKDLNLILISHAHYDHLDIPSLKRLPRAAIVIVPWGNSDLIKGLGFSRVVEMKWGESFAIDGLRVEAFQPAHWGKRHPFDGEGRGYNSYLLTKNGKSILFAGDTGYSKIFAAKGEQGTKTDELIEAGKTSVLDLSCYSSVGAFNVRALIIGLISRKLFTERMLARKKEE